MTKLDFANIIDAVNKLLTLFRIEHIIMDTNSLAGVAEVIFGSNTLQITRNVNFPIIAVPEGSTYEQIKSILLSLNYQYDVSPERFKVLLETVKKHKVSLKIPEIEERNIELSEQKNRVEEIFKEIAFKRYAIKNIPAPIAISAFQELISIQLHAMVSEPKSFLDRFIFGSTTSKINYRSQVPLLVLQE